MLWQRVRFVLLAGAVLAGTALSVRAEDAPPAAKDAPASDPSAPAMTRVLVNEWVPETYQTTRTSYRMEQRVETYTANRVECVPETRTHTVTVMTMRPEVQTVTRTVSYCVPTCEQRTVMQAHYTCKPVTCVVRKCVDLGHYECCEVPCPPTFRERLRKLCGKDCCECPRTKIEKVWVPCKTWVETPVTTMERVCEYRPVTVNVTVYKRECRQEAVQVTVCKCVPETRTETCTVMVQKCTPYQATRTVCVCVPHQEAVTATRLVCRTVEKLVPAGICGSPCGSCCETTCCSCAKARRCCK